MKAWVTDPGDWHRLERRSVCANTRREEIIRIAP